MDQAGKREWLERMRRDWDERARTDAEHFIYTRDNEGDVADFDSSGEANYNQLLRPYLPLLLDGKDPAKCRVVEVGCGAGRMTQWLARSFGEVHGIDVSPRMVQLAAERLDGLSDVKLTVGDGQSLAPLPSGYFDLVFSYIVFQHIPSRDIIAGYVKEAARVLRDGGAFKFQVSGAVGNRESSDTWLGVALSLADVTAMLAAARLELIAVEGEGAQQFVITARKGEPAGRGLHLLPASETGARRLLDGWREAVDGSWRAVEHEFAVLLPGRPPAGGVPYLGIYFWPEDDEPHVIQASAGGQPLGSNSSGGSGDHFLEFRPLEAGAGERELRFRITPAPRRLPACRILGCYAPAPSSLPQQPHL